MTPASDLAPAQRAAILRAAASLGVLGNGATSGPRLLSVLCDPTASARTVAQLLDREPALSARVLRVANSAFYGRSRTVSSIDKAIVLLGLDSIRGIAAAACLERLTTGPGAVTSVSLPAIVAHSIATAAAADELARRLRVGGAADAFLTGLLHNLGVFMQLRLDPARMQQVAEALAEAPEADIRAVEAAGGVVGHEQCFEVLAEEWNFPEPMAAAAGHHHRPLQAPAPHQPFTAIISLAANLAWRSGHHHPLEPGGGVAARDAAALLAIEAAVLEEIGGLLPTRVAEFRSALSAA
ncbi:MAG: HDOD domain-containing protein [Proteobacteria bacterium]|nr:HDOD domain-containing protein [Pseudomonadota bacterium]